MRGRPQRLHAKLSVFAECPRIALDEPRMFDAVGRPVRWTEGDPRSRRRCRQERDSPFGLRWVSVATSALLWPWVISRQDLRFAVCKSLAAAWPVQSAAAAWPKGWVADHDAACVDRLKGGDEVARPATRHRGSLDSPPRHGAQSSGSTDAGGKPAGPASPAGPLDATARIATHAGAGIGPSRRRCAGNAAGGVPARSAVAGGRAARPTSTRRRPA